MEFLNPNILLNTNRLHITLSLCENQQIYPNWISKIFVKRLHNILYKEVICFVDMAAMFHFDELLIHRKNKIKLFSPCMMNQVIKARMPCLWKFHNAIGGKSCMPTWRIMFNHVTNVSIKQIIKERKSYTPHGFQVYGKRLQLMLSTCHWTKERNFLLSHVMIYLVGLKQKCCHHLSWSMLWSSYTKIWYVSMNVLVKW